MSLLPVLLVCLNIATFLFLFCPPAFLGVLCCRPTFFNSVMFLKNNEVKPASSLEITCELEHAVLCLVSALKARLRETEPGLPQKQNYTWLLFSVQLILPGV